MVIYDVFISYFDYLFLFPFRRVDNYFLLDDLSLILSQKARGEEKSKTLGTLSEFNSTSL